MNSIRRDYFRIPADPPRLGASVRETRLFEPRNAIIHPSRRGVRALTLVEVMITMTLFSLLMAGGLTAITTMQSTARRQGVYNSALALVESKHEWFRAQGYAPPASPFLATTNTITESVALTLSETGTTNVVTVTLTSTVAVVSSGHLVTVVATYTYRNKPVTISIQTVVNAYSVANARLS